MAQIFSKKPDWAVREKGKSHLEVHGDPEDLPLDVSRVVHSWLYKEAKRKYDMDHVYFDDLEGARDILVQHYGDHWKDVPVECIRDMWRSDIEWWKQEERTMLARNMRDEAKYLALTVQQINNQLCRQIIEAGRNIWAMLEGDDRAKHRLVEQMEPAVRQAQRYKNRPIVLDDSAA